MDRNVTVRFYEIDTQGDGRRFDETLRHAYDRGLADRESEVGDGLVLRLEQLEEADGLLVGDFTRVQTDNLPSHPTGDATDPLPIDRLGHHTAFCFDPISRIIALQFDIKMAVGRICRYANSFSGGPRYGNLPVLRQDALERFEEETPTKFTVKIARVNQFGELGVELDDYEQTFERMGALFDAPTVEITVSARITDGGLDKETVLEKVRRFIGLRERFPGVRSISGETDESPDPFNFLAHMLKSSTVLDLPRNEPIVGRGVRMVYARQCFDEHRDYLRATYAPPAGG